MAVNLSPIWGAGAQLLDNSGNVLTGGKIYTYAAGTTTPATTYTSSSGITANSNPIILNSAGRVPYEIWLTDGTSYKFVLKDSNDTLIATYDNLIGINSNFIAYTSQQEIQTATAGQTVFNLTTMQYQPGTNSLSVYVDGVNQYGPGAQYAYVETDSDTVTFVNGLHVGASVKFTTATPVSSGSTNAENVAYDPPFTGAVATNVEAKLAQTVSVKDFGAVGDGVTDDTQAIQDAIDYLDSVDGGTLEFPKGTYGITGTIFVKSNITLYGQGRPEIIAIDDISGAMIQFGYTTGAVLDPPTNPCYNAQIDNFVINADYKVTKVVYNTGVESGVVYVWRACTYNKILNCEIKSAECGLVEVENDADFFELRNCEVHDMTSYSIATVTQNLVNVDGPTNAIIDNNNIYGLVISGYSPSIWGFGIRLHATDSAVVSNNRVESGYHNILVDGRSNLITGNRCIDGTQSSIILFENLYLCKYNTVIGNYCNNSNRGIWIEDGGYPDRVMDNFIAFNTVRNVNFNTTVEGQNTTVFQNNVFDTTDTIFPKLDYFGSTYTPFLSNQTNISSSTAYECQYTKINDVVTVSGKINITPTATGAFDLRITVPISTSNFTDSGQAAGTAHDGGTQSAGIYAQVTSKVFRMTGSFSSTSARSWYFTATYRIV